MGSIFEFGWHACAQAYLLALMSTVLSPAEAEPGCPPRRDAPHPMRTATAASRTAGVDPAADGEPGGLRRLATARGPGVATFNATI